MVAKDFVTKVLGIKDAQTITAMATTKEGNYERKKKIHSKQWHGREPR